MKKLTILSLFITLSAFIPSANANFFNDLSRTGDYENDSEWRDYSPKENKWSGSNNSPHWEQTNSWSSEGLVEYSAQKPSHFQVMYVRAMTNVYARIDVAACCSAKSSELKKHALIDSKRSFEQIEVLIASYIKDYEDKNFHHLNNLEKQFNEKLESLEIALLTYERTQLAYCAESQCECNLLNRHITLKALCDEFPSIKSHVTYGELIGPSGLLSRCRRTEAVTLKHLAAPLYRTEKAKESLAAAHKSIGSALKELLSLTLKYKEKHGKTNKLALRMIENRFFGLRLDIERGIKQYEEKVIAGHSQSNLQWSE